MSTLAQPAGHTERSPLLNANTNTIDNGAVERHGQGEEGAGDNDASVLAEPTTSELLRVMAGIYLGTFLAALDSTLVATISAPISADFNSLSLLSWLASGYFIANAAFQPLAGKMTDIYGRRAGLLFSNFFFAAGNLICGFAKEEWVIILGRVVAGCGGGGLNAISTFVASDLIPLRRRGLWQGFGNIWFGVGLGVGGGFGGWINDTVGWRWAFLAQVPLTVVSGLLVLFTVKIPVKAADGSKVKRIDFLGALTLVTTLVLMLLGLNSGGNVVPWTHPLVLTSLPLSALSLLAFLYIESRYAAEPVIPVRLFLNRTVTAACFTNWFITMALFGILFYGPLYFQVQGYSAAQSGLRLVPEAIGVGIASIGCGIIMRSTGKYYFLNICTQIVFVTAFVLFSTCQLDTPAWPPFIYFFLAGLGYSAMLTVTLLALIASVDHEFQAVITSASYAFRSTGSTIGITIASSVFQNTLTSGLWARIGDRKEAGEIISKVRDSLDVVKSLPDGLRTLVTEAYMEALRRVFWTLLGLAVLGAFVSTFMREHRLHNTISRRDSS